MTVPTGVGDRTVQGVEPVPKHSKTCGTTLRTAVDEAEDLFPPCEATAVSVRILLSKEANSITFLFELLETLKSENNTLGLPPLEPQDVAPVLPKLLLPAWHNTVGIRKAFENEPPPDPPDCAKAALVQSSIATTVNQQKCFLIQLS